MRKRALRKDFYMEIRRNFGRFLSIFLIVALGVAFYSGIQATAPDMRYAGDKYFDERELMDIRVMGTLGITKEDVAALESLDSIEKAEPGYAADVLCKGMGENDVIHMEALLPTLNQVEVLDGKMPERTGECLLDALFDKLEAE